MLQMQVICYRCDLQTLRMPCVQLYATEESSRPVERLLRRGLIRRGCLHNLSKQ